MEINTVKQNIKTTKRVYISIVAIGDGVEGIFYLIALLDLFIVFNEFSNEKIVYSLYTEHHTNTVHHKMGEN